MKTDLFGGSVGGVCAKQRRDYPRKKLPPPSFEFSPKALRNPKVEFAKTRSRFGDYYKMVRHHDSTINTE